MDGGWIFDGIWFLNVFGCIRMSQGAVSWSVAVASGFLAFLPEIGSVESCLPALTWLASGNPRPADGVPSSWDQASTKSLPFSLSFPSRLPYPVLIVIFTL